MLQIRTAKNETVPYWHSPAGHRTRSRGVNTLPGKPGNLEFFFTQFLLVMPTAYLAAGQGAPHQDSGAIMLLPPGSPTGQIIPSFN